jgi:hypothetical protein
MDLSTPANLNLVHTTREKIMVRTVCVCSLVIILSVLASVRAREKKTDTAKPKQDDALRKELLRMVEVDQAARKEVIKAAPGESPAFHKMLDIDRKNTARLKEIVDKHGWPGKSLVGADGAHAAWLLVQHADLDRDFQKRCLKLLERAVKVGEATGTDLAYLTDRVLVAEKKKQLYGTQFRQVEGNMEPYPIEDEANVDRRRKEVGLSSLAEYRKTLEKVYKAKTPSKPSD